MAEYKLSAQLSGHEADVRDVCFPSPAQLLSASRDHTVRSWQLTSQPPAPPAYQPTTTNKGSEFVNSLTYLPTSSAHPKGLIVSGGTDSVIDVRAPTATATDDAERLLIGHARNVCSLAVLPNGKFLVSGSWDNTARVWSVEKWETEVFLMGHEAAVWAVLPLDDNTVATGCADKNIRIFDLRRAVAGDVQARATIQGADVVRALCKVPASHPSGADIASASNDGVIRLYKLNGQLVAELHGHESFIYSLAALPSGELVSSGEDRTVRIWRGSECVQTITHPAISVWTVAICSANGDIASGASDGEIRIFTRSEERLADAETQKQFEDAVKSSAIPQQQMGDKINKEKLPGPDFLKTRSGTKEGQIQMIKEENGSISAHTWSSAAQQWVNVGTVVDAVGSTGNKVEYAGQTWDYVFDVAIEEGQPSLKLPYNLSENPYDRATKFINDNELSLNYLDQVANFIVENTKGATIGQSSEGVGADPFGTESRYRPGEEVSEGRTRAIPQKEYLDITAAKYDPIFNKILKTNEALIAAGQKDASLNPASTNSLNSLRKALEAGQPVTEPEAIELVLMMCTEWSAADRLAPMDLLRCIAVSPAVAKVTPNPVEIAYSAADIVDAARSPPNENRVMMALRAVANLFRSADGRTLLSGGGGAQNADAPLRAVEIMEAAAGFGPAGTPVGENNRNVQIALGTVGINFAVLATTKPGSVAPELQVRIFRILGQMVQKQNDGEVVFRALVGAGTLLSGGLLASGKVGDAKSLQAPVRQAKDRVSDQRVKEVADEVLGLL